MKKIFKDRRGFSLVEILIVVVIAVSVVLVVSNLNSNVSLLNGLVSQELQSKSDVTQTLEIMTSEIRSAGPSANGAYLIDTAATSTFIFYSDINKNGVIDRVRYFLASSTIYRGVTTPTGTPATYVTSTEVVTNLISSVLVATGTPLFSYYNSAYTGSQPALTSTIDVSPIRLVGISFSSQAQPKQSTLPQYFYTLIDIRNLQNN